MKSSSVYILFKKITAGALLFYFFSGITSLLNYLFYPVIARFVSIEQYGEIQFLVSMFNQFAVGFVILNILAIVIGVKISNAPEQAQALKKLNRLAINFVLVLAAIGSIILLIFQDNLNISSQFVILALAFGLLMNVPFNIAVGYLQGNNRFMASGVLTMFGAFMKLTFSLLFVVLGFGVTGAIAGIGVGIAVSLLVVLFVRKQVGKTHKDLQKNIAVPAFTLSTIKNQAIAALIGIIVITLLSTIDSVVSRAYMSTTEAGQYAAVATLAKVILAATSPIMWLALPSAVRHNRPMLLKCITLTVAAAGAAALLFGTFPEFFIQILLGVDAGPFSDILWLASLSMAICSLAFLLIAIAVSSGHLKAVLTSTLMAILGFLITYLLLPHVEPVQAALYGQSIASACYIALLGPRILARQ